MNPLAMATDGYLTGNGLQPLAMATSGYVVASMVVVYTPLSRGGASRVNGYLRRLKDEIAVEAAIQQDDEDVLTMTAFFFTISRQR